MDDLMGIMAISNNRFIIKKVTTQPVSIIFRVRL